MNKSGRLYIPQWRSQIAEKVTHIKGRLLGQAALLFNCFPFQNGNFSLREEFAPRGSDFFPLRAVPYDIENHFYHILTSLEYYYFYFACVSLRNGSFANVPYGAFKMVINCLGHDHLL